MNLYCSKLALFLPIFATKVAFQGSASHVCLISVPPLLKVDDGTLYDKRCRFPSQFSCIVHRNKNMLRITKDVLELEEVWNCCLHYQYLENARPLQLKFRPKLEVRERRALSLILLLEMNHGQVVHLG